MKQECKVDATVDDMERALDTIIGEIIRLRDMNAGNTKANFRQTPHARSGPARTPFKLALDLIASSPIDGSLRLAARDIGHGLFAVLQNPQTMMRLARRVCSQDEVNWSKRMTIIDAAWEGIGSETYGYWG
jgi:hypothetical protein